MANFGLFCVSAPTQRTRFFSTPYLKDCDWEPEEPSTTIGNSTSLHSQSHDISVEPNSFGKLTTYGMSENNPPRPPPWDLQESGDDVHVHTGGRDEEELFSSNHHPHDLDPVSWEEGLRAIEEFDWPSEKGNGSVDKPGHDTQESGKVGTCNVIPVPSASVAEEKDKIGCEVETPVQTQSTGSILSEPDDAHSPRASLSEPSAEESWDAELQDTIDRISQLSLGNDSTLDEEMSPKWTEPPSALPQYARDILLGNLQSKAVLDYFADRPSVGVKSEPSTEAAEAPSPEAAEADEGLNSNDLARNEYISPEPPSALPQYARDILLGNLQSKAVLDYFADRPSVGVKSDSSVEATEADEDLDTNVKVECTADDDMWTLPEKEAKHEGDTPVLPKTPTNKTITSSMYTPPPAPKSKSKSKRRVSDNDLDGVSPSRTREQLQPLARQLFSSGKKSDEPLTLASSMDSPRALGPRALAPRLQSDPEGPQAAQSSRVVIKKGKAPAEKHNASFKDNKKKQPTTPAKSGQRVAEAESSANDTIAVETDTIAVETGTTAVKNDTKKNKYGFRVTKR